MRYAVITALIVLYACEGSERRRGPDPAADTTPPVRPTVAPPTPPASPVPASPSAALRTALEQLLQGPTAAQVAAGEHSWFSAATAGALRSVAVDSTGHATVDFRDLRSLIPNASSSAGSAALLEELNTTVFQVRDVRSVEYRMDGSCDLFWEWLQYGCRTVSR